MNVKENEKFRIKIQPYLRTKSVPNPSKEKNSEKKKNKNLY